jgi:replicative DNA helicase
MMMSAREIPNSREAENYVLGSILIEGKYAEEVVNRLYPSDFYYPENANIMTAITELVKINKVIDVTSIIECLREKKLLEATGGPEYLFDLMDAIPSVVNVEAYIEIIKEHFQQDPRQQVVISGSDRACGKGNNRGLKQTPDHRPVAD